HPAHERVAGLAVVGEVAAVTRQRARRRRRVLGQGVVRGGLGGRRGLWVGDVLGRVPGVTEQQLLLAEGGPAVRRLHDADPFGLIAVGAALVIGDVDVAVARD